MVHGCCAYIGFAFPSPIRATFRTGRRIAIGVIGGVVVAGGILVTDPLDRLSGHDVTVTGGIVIAGPGELHDHQEGPPIATARAAPAPGVTSDAIAVTNDGIAIDGVRVELSRNQDGEWRGIIMSKKDRRATKRDIRQLEERLTARLGGALAVLLIALAVTTIVLRRDGTRRVAAPGPSSLD